MTWKEFKDRVDQHADVSDDMKIAYIDIGYLTPDELDIQTNEDGELIVL